MHISLEIHLDITERTLYDDSQLLKTIQTHPDNAFHAFAVQELYTNNKHDFASNKLWVGGVVYEVRHLIRLPCRALRHIPC